jgi:hypothetical protein
MRIFILLLLFIFSLTNIHSQTNRTENWTKDIDYLMAEIKKHHYVYKNKELPPAMIRQTEELKKRIAAYSDERMLIELGRLMYHLGDGHSYILPLGSKLTESQFLPLRFYEFSDGMFVVDADEARAHLVGMKVRKIADVTPAKFMQDMVTFVSQDNPMGAKWIGPFFMGFRGMLESYNLPRGASGAKIVFENKQGKTLTEEVPFVPAVIRGGLPKMSAPKNTPAEKIPLYLSNVAENFWLKEFPERKAIYFQFNQVQNSAKETLAAFSGRLEAELTAKKARLLIIDVRHNNGGNGNLTPALINVLKAFEQSRQGKIVIITGRNTFSATQIFISRVDKETNARFAGEISSSKPNFVGEENEVVLPYSGARGSISNRYHENIPGDTRPWIEPDLKILLSSKDFFANRDPVLEAVFKKYAKSNSNKPSNSEVSQ